MCLWGCCCIKIWNTPRICVSSLRRGHANLLCIVPILVYVLPKWALNTKFDAGPLLYSLVLNVMATQYTCSLSGIYHPHWLVAWSHHCSCIRIPVPSPWLSGYTDVVQTILVILRMVGHFPDRLYIYMNICINNHSIYYDCSHLLFYLICYAKHCVFVIKLSFRTCF